MANNIEMPQGEALLSQGTNNKGRIRNALNAMVNRVASPVPEYISTELQRLQYDKMRSQIPQLHITVIIITLVVLATAARDGAPVPIIIFLGMIVYFYIFRMLYWTRKRRSATPPEDLEQFLFRIKRLMLISVAVIGMFSAYMLVSDIFTHKWVVPVGICLGLMCVAYTFSTMRVASISILLLGLFPNIVVMLTTGDFTAITLGVILLCVTVLHIHFINEQYQQIISTLTLEKQISEQANRDVLTQLANRRAFMMHFRKAIANYDGEMMAVMLMDLDGFKQINDNLGHQAGDRVLKTVGNRLQNQCQKTEFPARLGGDEFVVLLTEVDDLNNAHQRCIDILEAMNRPITLGTDHIHFSVSIGYAICPLHGKSASQLLAAADCALYTAKSGGKARACAYAPGKQDGSEHGKVRYSSKYDQHRAA